MTLILRISGKAVAHIPAPEVEHIRCIYPEDKNPLPLEHYVTTMAQNAQMKLGPKAEWVFAQTRDIFA